jgi:hypothetical protein
MEEEKEKVRASAHPERGGPGWDLGGTPGVYDRRTTARGSGFDERRHRVLQINAGEVC